MSWLITGAQKTDPDALAYLAEVERADGQALESGVRDAVIAFVAGCKADGIWNAIKASCILAGARTLNGALVPLVGTAPANVGPFVSGDYNRKTGLVGNGSTKYLNSNRAGNADPQNSKHAGVYVQAATTVTGFYFADEVNKINLSASTSDTFSRLNSSSQITTAGAPVAGFAGLNRASSASYQLRKSTTNTTINEASVTPSTAALSIYSRTVTPDFYSNARLAFYSIGESIDLARLDSRVTALINAFAAVIP